MIVLLSPAKSLEINRKSAISKYTQPAFKEDADKLADKLKKYSKKKLNELLKVNDKLLDENYMRYQLWQHEPSAERYNHALMIFTGEVYRGLQAEHLNQEDFSFAQKHLRILSGLYGILRPLDAVQAYRLEMGAKLDVGRGKNLYDYWKDKITKHIQDDFGDNQPVINLASNEYSKAIDFKKMNNQVITPVFKDEKNGQYKVLFVYAKKARGMMARFIIDNRVTEPEQIKAFDREGYFYNNELSNGNEWVFTR